MHKINRSMGSLHPKFVGVFQILKERLVAGYETGVTKTRFEVFETFRGFERQDYLFASGTTKARGGQSAHNFGLAVDFVPVVYNTTQEGLVGEWSWSLHHEWDFLKEVATAMGLENQSPSLRWDKPHVQVKHWRSWVEPDVSWIG